MAERNKAADDKLLKLARDRFKAAVEAESENRAKQLDDLKFLAASPDDNWQWPTQILNQRTAPGQEGGPRPCLTINKLPQHHRQVTNEQRMNRPQIKVQPVDDKGDPEVAKIYNGMTRHIQVASEADLAYDMACDAQVAGGEGYFRILTQYCDERSFDQDIVIAPLPDRFKVYMDPIGLLQHPTGKKCGWGFVIEDLPKEEYEDMYGDDHPVDWGDAGVGDQAEWFPDKKTVRIAEYFEIEQKKAKLYLWANGTTSIEGEKLPEGVTAVERPVNTRDTKIPQCKWRKITGQAVLDEREMPTKYLPIVRVIGNQWIIEGKPIVSGLVRPAKDAQRMYNYNASMEVEMNALAPKAPFVGYAEQFQGHEEQWKRANTVPYAFLKVNLIMDEATGQPLPLPFPQRAQPAMPQQAIIAAKLSANDDIKATTGQYDPSLGNQSNETSGKAINARKVQTEVGTFHYVDNLARALRYAGTIIVDMIPRVYDTKRIARILGEDGEPDHVQIDPSQPKPYQEIKDQASGKIAKIYNLGIGKYDVVVNVGPSYTTKRQEATETMTALIQAQPEIMSVIGDLYFKAQDIPYADEFSKRMKAMLAPPVQAMLKAEEQNDGNVDPQVQAAMQQAELAVAAVQEQLAAAQAALQERDAMVKDLKGKLDGKNVDAMAKMYEADKKALAEIEKAKAEVLIARANAITEASKQPENADLAGVVQGLDAMLAQMDQKIAALAESSAAIAQQLQAFEIALSQPQTLAA